MVWRNILKRIKVVAYIGFDATAPSLHVGSLCQIMLLRLLQQSGNKPLVLMGGGTSIIGDPTFRDTERQLLSSHTVNSNVENIKKVFSNFLHFGSGETDAVMLNNGDWLTRINYLDFLEQFGDHFSINRMLTLDSVKT